MNLFYKKTFFLICLILAFANSKAQSTKTRCASGDIIKNAIQTERFRIIQQKIKQGSINLNRNKSDTVITIPVIVHVIYKNDAEKIYNDQVYSQIEVLNEDFRRLNSDISRVPAEFSNVIADVKIEFCLAKQKPDGSYTNGIIYVPTNQDNVGQRNLFFNISPTWGDEYLNIWVCDYGGNIAGRATIPGSVAPNQDGIIIDYTNFGTIGTVQSPYHLGRTLTHEVGHWLNLFHIWGDDEDPLSCSNDDLVSDTPFQSEIYYNCPTTKISCGNRDMTTNFMGYVNDACMVNFTEGQKTRMRAALIIERSSVVNSTKGCSVVGLQENFNSINLSLFPNPSNGITYLKTTIPEGFNGYTIEIMNQFGQTLYANNQFSGSLISLETSDYNSGVYFIKIKKNGFLTIKKLILNNR